ncbi:efflux RND transporter periplasmic adaptor subunit [Aequoribacter sp.]|uniref:efflux RND transporter periplasmic adaptor subunit n=1 Tax=Aequoribacter sp. TaxID=2847771 RepID=UPI003F695146
MRAYLLSAGLLIAIFGSVGTYLYNKFSALAEMDFSPAPVTVNAELAQVETIQRKILTVGTIIAEQESVLKAEVSGRVSKLLFKGGQTVDDNQILVQLDDGIEQAELRRYEAELALAETLLNRDRELAKEKAISQTQLDTRAAQFQAASARVEETLARIRQKRLLAPFTGLVGVPMVNVGDYVNAGESLVTITTIQNLEAEFNLPATQARDVEVGLRVRIETADQELLAEGKISEADPRLDPIDRTRGFRAQLNSTDLFPGEFVRIAVLLKDQSEAITVPETAVTYALRGDAVYVVEQTDTGPIASMRMVTTGEHRGQRVEIRSGINLGDQVITAGQHKLYSGASVTVSEDSPL